MIRLKYLISETSDTKILGKSANFNSSAKYTDRLVPALKILGVNHLRVIYNSLFGKNDTNSSNATLTAKLTWIRKCRSKAGKGKGGNFWEISDNILWEILETARDNYKKLVKKHHPDLGGEHEKMALINRAWEIVEYSFQKKGYELPE